MEKILILRSNSILCVSAFNSRATIPENTKNRIFYNPYFCEKISSANYFGVHLKIHSIWL